MIKIKNIFNSVSEILGFLVYLNHTIIFLLNEIFRHSSPSILFDHLVRNIAIAIFINEIDNTVNTTIPQRVIFVILYKLVKVIHPIKSRLTQKPTSVLTQRR